MVFQYRLQSFQLCDNTFRQGVGNFVVVLTGDYLNTAYVITGVFNRKNMHVRPRRLNGLH